jgi:diacylglycerol kinase family enzyme
MNAIGRSATRFKKRALVIVNPQAASVSGRLKNLVVYALQGRYEVEVVDTRARSDATLIGLETRDARYDVIIAFGGDGTFNEVVNAFAGTGIPVTVLPGGSANVACRALGIPTDVVDATEHLLGLPDDWHPRQVGLGKVDGRRFFSACGAGIDAAVIKHIDDRPQLREKLGPYFAGWATLSTYYRRYLASPVRLSVQTSDGRKSSGISAFAQNGDTLTYLGQRPIRISESVSLDDGMLAIGVLAQLNQRDLTTLIARLMVGAPGARHRQVNESSKVTAATIVSLSTDPQGSLRPFPVQVDGEYIGTRASLKIRVEPDELTVIS